MGEIRYIIVKTHKNILIMAQFEIKDGIAIIPEGTKTIPNEAFCGCASLTNIVIPNSVTVIGDGAFNGCASLINVVIPDSVTEIGWVLLMVALR